MKTTYKRQRHHQHTTKPDTSNEEKEKNWLSFTSQQLSLKWQHLDVCFRPSARCLRGVPLRSGPQSIPNVCTSEVVLVWFAFVFIYLFICNHSHGDLVCSLSSPAASSRTFLFGCVRVCVWGGPCAFGCLSEWMNEWVDEWVSEFTSACLNECVHARTWE